METITIIPKEELHTLKFSKNDVIDDVTLRQKRRLKLNRALILGNRERNKTKITFMTENGNMQQVETTIWGLTQNFILLKAGASIPIRSVLQVEF
jgi:hypothetical protein